MKLIIITVLPLISCLTIFANYPSWLIPNITDTYPDKNLFKSWYQTWLGNDDYWAIPDPEQENTDCKQHFSQWYSQECNFIDNNTAQAMINESEITEKLPHWLDNIYKKNNSGAKNCYIKNPHKTFEKLNNNNALDKQNISKTKNCFLLNSFKVMQSNYVRDRSLRGNSYAQLISLISHQIQTTDHDHAKSLIFNDTNGDYILRITPTIYNLMNDSVKSYLFNEHMNNYEIIIKESSIKFTVKLSKSNLRNILDYFFHQTLLDQGGNFINLAEKKLAAFFINKNDDDVSDVPLSVFIDTITDRDMSKLENTYGTTSAENCYGTSLHVSDKKNNQCYLEPNLLIDNLQTNYNLIATTYLNSGNISIGADDFFLNKYQFQMGDILVLKDSNDTLVHSFNYMFGDIGFSKNGLLFTHPSVYQKISTTIGIYSGQAAKLEVYRAK